MLGSSCLLPAAAAAAFLVAAAPAAGAAGPGPEPIACTGVDPVTGHCHSWIDACSEFADHDCGSDDRTDVVCVEQKDRSGSTHACLGPAG